MQGERIGKYLIGRKLGEGGMGVVYEAVNEIERHVAIKVLRPDLSQDAELAERFFNEARAANIVDHPGIVSIHEHGRLPGGTTYIVMELLKGESLRARLQRGALTSGAAVRLARQVASALGAAHAKHIIHRDLKPENVMLVPDPDMPGGERVKVLDFGIAKLAAEYRQTTRLAFGTEIGTVMGSPHYMAPEQCRGAERVDDRCDVYSLGVMLYEMLAGTRPFDAPQAQMVMARHLAETPPPLDERMPGLAPELLSLVYEMMGKDPAARPSMPQVLERLGALGGAIQAQATLIHTPAAAVLFSSRQARVNSTLNRGELGAGRGLPAAPPWVRWGGGAMVLLSLTVGAWTLRPAPHRQATPLVAPLPEPPRERVSAPPREVAPAPVAAPLPAPGLGMASGAADDHAGAGPEPDRRREPVRGAMKRAPRHHPEPESGKQDLRESSEAVAAVPKPAPAPAPAPAPPPPAPPPSRSAGAAEPAPPAGWLSNAEGLERIKKAQQAAQRGDDAEAISQARPATRSHAASLAWALLGTSACHLGDLAQAHEAFRHAGQEGQAKIQGACVQRGIYCSPGSCITLPPVR